VKTVVGDPVQVSAMLLFVTAIGRVGVDSDVWDTKNLLYRLAREEYPV